MQACKAPLDFPAAIVALSLAAWLRCWPR